jgi:hypothetical protein
MAIMKMLRALASVFCFNLLWVTVGCFPTTPATSSCLEPSRKQLQSQLHEILANDMALAENAARNLDEDLSELIVESDPLFDIHLYGTKNQSHCQKSHIECPHGLAHCSFCPWYHVISRPASIINREMVPAKASLAATPIRTFPSELAEARCRCSEPALPGSFCSPVREFRRILIKSRLCGSDGIYTYSPAWQRVSIACVLVREDPTKPGHIHIQ